MLQYSQFDVCQDSQHPHITVQDFQLLDDCKTKRKSIFIMEWFAFTCKIGPSGAHYYFCFNLSSIIESYLEYQYVPVQSLFSAQLITVQVYGEFRNNIRANNKNKISFK